MATQGASITVQGGLDLVSSSHALFRTPGAATKLQNFESSTTCLLYTSDAADE